MMLNDNRTESKKRMMEGRQSIENGWENYTGRTSGAAAEWWETPGNSWSLALNDDRRQFKGVVQVLCSESRRRRVWPGTQLNAMERPGAADNEF